MKSFSKLALWTLGLICIFSFSMMLWASRTDSAIDDELAHIPAGYDYVHQLDYRLNPEHPPLIKALAMLPVLFLNPIFPTTNTAWTTEVNGQWDMGTQFLYAPGNNADAIIQAARVLPILITIITIILIYCLARKLLGDWWALMPATLFAFSPTILAHGHYVTTDVGAAFGIVLATYFFLNFIEKPETRTLWFAGITFGIAQITKFSTPLLIPLFLFIFILLWVRKALLEWRTMGGYARFKKVLNDGLHHLRNFLLIIAIGYIFIVYPIYFLFTLHYPIVRQVADTQAILTSFANGPTPTGTLCKGLRCLADVDIWAAKNPILRPYAQYLLGLLMVIQRADGGNTIYFLGNVVRSGGWLYFPILYLIKEPIPSLIIVIVGLFLALYWALKRAKNAHFRVLKPISDYIGLSLGELTMGSFIALYWGYSMHTLLTIGIRHVIPTLPFIYILAAGAWKKWIIQTSPSTGLRYSNNLENFGRFLKTTITSLFRAFLKYLFLVILLIWLLLESFTTAPYFLSYFNEFARGTANGYHYVTDSNYDWGQDLLRLKTWLNGHPEVNVIAVDYFGGGNPYYYLGSKEIDWHSAKGNPTDQNIHWLAVSVNVLEGAIAPLAPGESRTASDTYAWLTAIRPPAPGMGNLPTPDYRVGTSIFVYHL